MYIYNVTVKVEIQRVDEWLTWMKEIHIPDVLSTGFFTEHRISRLLDEGELNGATFVIQYSFDHLDDYLNYQLVAAPALQKEHNEKFGQDVHAFRTLMELLN